MKNVPIPVQDLSAVTISYRMFERWRQENFFKYMSEEFALDALVDYDVEEDDLTRLVPNPKRKEITRERKKIKAKIKELQSQYARRALENEEAKRPTMRGFKIANSEKVLSLRIIDPESLRLAYPAIPPNLYPAI